MVANVYRPHLLAFLAAVHTHYDIVIWSANSMKWMNVKMKALGVLDNDNFKVTFMLDYRSMLTVKTSKYGVQLLLHVCMNVRVGI
jgi:ubiquitin-like domain-containing CTD phosphatase 1